MSYVVVLEDVDVVWLAWAAGLADGRGHVAAGEALTGIIERLQPVDQQYAEAGPHYGDNQNDDLNDFPAWGVDPLPEEALVDVERDVDPQFMPPAQAPPMGYDVGAGPPPGGFAGVNP